MLPTPEGKVSVNEEIHLADIGVVVMKIEKITANWVISCAD